MSFYSQLSERLDGRLSEGERALLPRSYQALGKVLILKVRPELRDRRKAIAEAILKMFPYISTICVDDGITGVKRKPKLDVYGGTTETVHREHGCMYFMDVRDVMFSKGNKAEKVRLAKLVKRGETVVDMFAGIGYWTIPMAVNAKPAKIYAIDINPKAAAFLEKNTWLNGVQGKVEILRGDCRKFAFGLKGVADRVVMGYLKGTERFLPFAIMMGKRDFTIHYHDVLHEKQLGAAERKIVALGRKYKAKITVKNVKKVKDYSPGINHYVFDLRVRRGRA